MTDVTALNPYFDTGNASIFQRVEFWCHLRLEIC